MRAWDGGCERTLMFGDVLKFAGSGGSDAERAERDSSVLGACNDRYS